MSEQSGPAPPALTVTAINLSAPDARALARFYARLLERPLTVDEPGWATVGERDGPPFLAFQDESDYAPPVWPGQRGDQRMMLHLEIQVADLAAAVAHALDCGARLAEHQPQPDVRVCLDPVGHPFCLYT